MTDETRFREGTVADAPACAAILNDWIDATDWLPRVHDPDDIEDYYRSVVLPRCPCLIAERDDEVCGFATLDREAGLVSALFLAEDARGQGIGKALLDGVKAMAPEGISLWTFDANGAAQRFYRREGFRPVARTDGDNEEGLPDILFRWTPEEAEPGETP